MLQTIKDAWAVGGILLAIVIGFYTISVKFKKATEQIDKVGIQEKKLEGLQKQVEGVEKTSNQMHDDIKKVQITLAELTGAVLSVMDELRTIRDSAPLTDALNKLREHIIHKD